jgi:hypothetical protein
MSDVDQAVEEVFTDDPSMEVEGTGEEQSPFFEYGEGDSALKFTTPDELKAHLDKSINFERDYTRKSQERESTYKQRMEEVEKQRKEFETQREKWEKEEKAKYDKYNEALQRRPSIARELERLATKPITPDEVFQRSQGYADEKATALEERLAQIESRYEQEQMERQTEAIYAELEGQYPDFNRDAVKEALSGLDGNDTRGLIETLWKASQYNPAAMQEKVEQNIAKKAGSGMLPSGGGSPPAKTKGSTDPRQVREAAIEWANSG